MGVVGVIIGIVGILCALMSTFLYGYIGCIVSVVIAIAAIVLGILKRKNAKKGGIAAIVTGAVALLLAIVMTSAWSSVFTKLHEAAMTYKPDGLWAKISEDTSKGLMGMIKDLPTDEASLQAYVDEMNELNKEIK